MLKCYDIPAKKYEKVYPYNVLHRIKTLLKIKVQHSDLLDKKLTRTYILGYPKIHILWNLN